MEDSKKDEKSFRARLGDKVLELLKYPIIGASIVLSLWMAKVFLAFDINSISELSTSTIKFRQATSDLSTQIVPLSEKVKVLEVSLDALLKSSTVDTEKVNNAIEADQEKIQTVTDNVEHINQLKISSGTPQILEGYIWIGNYNEASKTWSTILLENIEKTTPLTDIREQTTYKVEGNMILRGTPPKAEGDYFKSSPNLGIIAKGTPVLLLEKPYMVKRATTQCWVKVRWSKNG